MSRHRDLMDVIPNCAACQDDNHTDCIPIVEATTGAGASVCACFAAHPDSEAHENAIYWWSSRNHDRDHWLR